MPLLRVGCGVVARRGREAVSVHGIKPILRTWAPVRERIGPGGNDGLTGRLLRPVVDGHEVDWAQALSAAGERLREIIDKWGPQAVAFYASGQLLTEDYYAANKLMKGFIARQTSIPTPGSVCPRRWWATSAPLAKTCAVRLRGYGKQRSGGAGCSNAAWTHPVLYQRLVQAKHDNPQMKVVVIDPRRTATCDIADLHLRSPPATTPGCLSVCLM